MQPQLTQKEKMILNVLSELLKEYRKNNSISQRILAYEYGIHKSMISRVESSSNSIFLLSFWRLAEAINMRPSELLFLVEKRLPDGFRLID